jgi:putative SOS response-associated peptidase YedK
MCGRYTLSTNAQVLADLFRLEEALALPPRYNIAPTQEVAIVRSAAEPGPRRLSLARWGLIPFWAKDRGIGAKMINARAEAAAEKPAFRSAFRSRRCLIPADGFFEWQAVGARRQPHHIRRRDGGVLAFAGLWERWGPREGDAVESCTILTTEPNDLLRPLHDRMPVILPPEAWPLWLDPEIHEPERVQPLLVPFPADAMIAYPVGLAVNSPRHDDPSCIEPLAGPPPPLRPPGDPKLF